MIIYLFCGGLVILGMIIQLYIRFKYPFWREQPIFHSYDFTYYLRNHGIINSQLPEKTKYYNSAAIVTTTQPGQLQRKELIQHHGENIMPYFEGHNFPCFFSFYKKPHMLIEHKSGKIIDTEKTVAVITSRPINININNGSKDAYFTAYLVDYLNIDDEYNRQGIGSELIYTHEYEKRHHKNKDNKGQNQIRIQISIFKREKEMPGIVPLTKYNTYIFNMAKWNKPTDLLPYVSLLECNNSNFQYLLDFLKDTNHLFELCAIVEMTQILELLKRKKIFIYFILKEEEGKILSAYFFKKSNTNFLSLFGSINRCKNNELFIHGYKVALSQIVLTSHKNGRGFQYTGIENISHNDKIISNLLRKNKPIKIKTAMYFFYNFAYPTFKPNKVLILN
jgi:hypothetical protein